MGNRQRQRGAGRVSVGQQRFALTDALTREILGEAMGTDVHAVIQKRTDKGWEPVESKWEQNRHYFLFSWLADVRNGFGFAGVKTYAPIKPIADQRGLPDDFNIDRDGVAPDPAWEDEGHYIGDHSYSWLMASEILAAERPKGAWRTGVIPIEAFVAWDGVTPPEAWSGGITGGGIRVAESPVDVQPDSTHVRIYWRATEDALDYFVDEIKRLHAEHGDVRLVFGFDS
jgi:hypothetical protein